MLTWDHSWCRMPAQQNRWGLHIFLFGTVAREAIIRTNALRQWENNGDGSGHRQNTRQAHGVGRADVYGSEPEYALFNSRQWRFKLALSHNNCYALFWKWPYCRWKMENLIRSKLAHTHLFSFPSAGISRIFGHPSRKAPWSIPGPQNGLFLRLAGFRRLLFCWARARRPSVLLDRGMAVNLAEFGEDKHLRGDMRDE